MTGYSKIHLFRVKESLPFLPKLNAMGIRGIFIPGTPMQHIIDYITANARVRV